jgi:hypothetical protein
MDQFDLIGFNPEFRILQKPYINEIISQIDLIPFLNLTDYQLFTCLKRGYGRMEKSIQRH